MTTPETEPSLQLAIFPSVTFQPTIRRLLSFADNWDSYGAPAPNFVAGINAELVLEELTPADPTPTRIVASAEGGIAITFRDGSKYADIETLNTGIILAVLSDRTTTPIVWQVEKQHIRETLGRIRDFIRV